MNEPNPIHLGGGSYVVTMIDGAKARERWGAGLVTPAVIAALDARNAKIKAELDRAIESHPFTPEELAKKAAHRAMKERGS